MLMKARPKAAKRGLTRLRAYLATQGTVPALLRFSR